MSDETANVISFTELYPIQSYFDAAAELTTPPSTAALDQPENRGFVQSTQRPKTSQSGYAIGLEPWSEAPVAVAFNFGESGSSSPVVLRPGQVIRPNGRKRFEGFEYGLPFGWLGGGLVALRLFKTENAEEHIYGEQSEILYHRLRTTILQEGDPTVAQGYVNWPNRFPWPKMYRYGTIIQPQKSNPVISISRTTRVDMRLNIAGADISADNTARIVFWGTDDFGTQANGVTVLNTDQFFYDISWPIPNSGSPAFAQLYNPYVSLPRDVAAQSSNQWGISIVAPVGSVLIGKTVDICRYGIL